MKKQISILLLLLFLAPSAKAATSTLDLGNPLNVEKEAQAVKGVWNKIMAVWNPINEKGISLWNKYLEKYLGKYALMLKENIKQGIEEERGELSESFKTGFKNGLDYIKKNIFERFFGKK